jgi:hypothetical protein
MRKFSTLMISSLLVLSSAVAAQASAAPKNWTFLVYLNGDNNLDSFGAQNIESMETVGSNDQVNIVVQWASEAAGKSVRLLVQKSTNPSAVISPIVQDLGKVDMGDFHSLENFIQWGVQNYPAQHYFIDVWDHGSGWHSIEAMTAAKRGVIMHPSDISWDDNSGNFITTEQLGQAMTFAAQQIGHKVDLYGSDACLMAMAEVANEMADSVSVYAGSQETEPGAGWPYGDLLSRWEAIPNAQASDVAKILVDAYVKSYQGGSNGTGEVTFAAYDMSKLPALDTAIANFGAKILKLSAADSAKVLATAKTTQNFTDADYGDLLDFMKKLSSSRVQGIDSQDISDVQAAASQMIIANSDTTQYAAATGMSIWLPTQHSDFDSNATRYKGLKFNAATHWGDVLNYLLQGASNSL